MQHVHKNFSAEEGPWHEITLLFRTIRCCCHLGKCKTQKK